MIRKKMRSLAPRSVLIMKPLCFSFPRNLRHEDNGSMKLDQIQSKETTNKKPKTGTITKHNNHQSHF